MRQLRMFDAVIGTTQRISDQMRRPIFVQRFLLQPNPTIEFRGSMMEKNRYIGSDNMHFTPGPNQKSID